MGYSSAGAIANAGKYLLDVLQEANQVKYSTFYDGSDEVHNKLMQSIGLEDDWYSPEHLMDLAAGTLAGQGFVEITSLDSLLVDGEKDYVIALTERGREMLARGVEPTYRDLE